MSKRLKVGIVGLGRIFDLHYPGYLDNPDAEIVSLCDIREDLLQKRSAAFPAAHATSDFEAFLSRKPDLVEVLTPHPLHAKQVVAALQAGCHVSVQKPMAMDLAEADRMIAAAKEAGRHLKVFENFVFYPPLVKARDLLMSGAIGKPLHFRMQMISGDRRFSWHVPVETNKWRYDIARENRGGPLVFDHGHHLQAVSLWLFGEIRDAFAWIETTPLPDGRVVDAPASLTWRHVDPPVHAIWDVSHAPKMRMRSDYYAGNEQFEIVGESGIIKVTRASARPLDEPVLTLYRDGEVRAFHNIESDWGLSFKLSTEHFVRFLCGKEAQMVLTAREGRRVLEFSHMLMKSAREGRVIGNPSV